MMTDLQAVILGGLQGIMELFPISSLGHTVILPSLLGWPINQHDEHFIVFIVATHVTTALILFAYYWSDWKNIIAGFFRSLKARKIERGDTFSKISWLLIIGTIPGGLLGLFFDAKFESIFARPSQAAFFLVVNGLLLYGAEMLRRKREEGASGIPEGIARLSFTQALGIGGAQALALFPGISRTGATIGAGLLAKLSHEEALTFSFLLAAPIIFAAGVLKLPVLLGATSEEVMPILIASIISGTFAFLSVHFLERYFRTKTLTPFAVYCVVAGVLSIIILG